MTNKIEQAVSQETMSLSFINNGEEFEIPLIRVSDIRTMQMKRSKMTDPDSKELEASITLAHALLSKIDSSVTRTMVEDMEYAEFLKFIKLLWGKNAANFRGILPNMPKTILER